MSFPNGQVYEEVWQFGMLMSHKLKEKDLTTNANTHHENSRNSVNLGQSKQQSRTSTYENKTEKSDLIQKEENAKINESLNLIKLKHQAKAKMNNTCLERIDVLNKMQELISKKTDLLQWQSEDIIEWLKQCNLE